MIEVYLCYYQIIDKYGSFVDTKHFFITRSKAIAEEYKFKDDVDFGDYTHHYVVECFELQ